MADIDFYSPRAGQVLLAVHGLLLVRAAKGTGVVDGNCISPTTPPSMDIDIDAGKLLIDNSGIEASADSVTIAAADSTLDRIDLLYRDTSGDVQVINGALAEVVDPQISGDWTHYTSPQPIDEVPDGVILGAIYVKHGVSAIGGDDIWMFAAPLLEASGDLADAIAKKHTQGTDQFLDSGGTNQVTAAQAKGAVQQSHVQGTDQHLDHGGQNESSAANVKDAVTKKHNQGTDVGLDTGGSNPVTAADLKALLSLLTSRGDVPYRDASGWQRLAAGPDRKVFTTHGTGADPTWEYITRTITFVLDGSGTLISTGIKGDLEIPFGCSIVACTMLADQIGSIVIDIWKDSYENAPPTVADTIVASAKPTISAALKSKDTTLTGWTKEIAAGSILRFNVDSCSSIQRLTLSLTVV